MAPVDEVVVSAGPGETRIALLAGGQVVEFLIDRGGVVPGDVIAGRVVEVAPSFGAAFVEIGEAQPAYLAKSQGLSQGAAVLVEVTAAARRGKGAEVKRAAADAVPARRTAIARAVVEHPQVARVAVDQASALPEARVAFAGAMHVPGCFEESGAADALEEAVAPRVALPGGGALIFAETEAATLIDIDGGGLSPAEVNRAAIPEIARQLRLRAIGGHILVDAIATRDRRAIVGWVTALREATAGDDAVQVAGHTPLGMIELTRRRRGPSLAEIMLEPSRVASNALTVGLQALQALLREAAARPAASLALAAAPSVIAALRSKPAALAEIERRLGRKLPLIERGGLDLFVIEEVA